MGGEGWEEGEGGRERWSSYSNVSTTNLWKGTECSQVDFTSRHSSNGIHYNGYPGFLVLLIQHLCPYIYSRQPAAIARVTVIPS